MPVRTAIRHQVVIGLGADGFRADCTCGWRSTASWNRNATSRTGSDHKKRSVIKEVP